MNVLQCQHLKNRQWGIVIRYHPVRFLLALEISKHETTNGLPTIFFGDMGVSGFPQMGVPPACWMVDFHGKILLKWMMTGGTAIYGNPHRITPLFS
jgi:hypothetical protein